MTPPPVTPYAGGGWVLPGAATVSEWLSPVGGFIKTCVEASEAVVAGIQRVMPATPQSTTRLALDQIARGEAGAAGGASNYASAGAQLARIGVPNQVLGPGWVRNPANNWVSAVNGALARGAPVLVGVPNASALTDDLTGARPDAGVRGHGLTIVGATARDYLVADPNTAPGSGFMHYSPSAFAKAGIDSLVIPTDAPPAVQPSGAPTNPLGFFYGGSSQPAATATTNMASTGGGSGSNPLQQFISSATSAPGSLSPQQIQNLDPNNLVQAFWQGAGNYLSSGITNLLLLILGIVVVAVALHALLNPGRPTVIAQVARGAVAGSGYRAGALAAARRKA